MYLAGWAPHIEARTRLSRVFSGMYAVYALHVGACGIALNIYLLVSVRRNTTQRIPKEGEAMTLATLGKECVRPLQGLIVFVMILDISAFFSFGVSLPLASGDDGRIYNGLVQISLALFGMHMSAETIMFERVVMIFRNKMPKEYVASVGIDNWQLGADVDAPLEDMNATSGRLQGRIYRTAVSSPIVALCGVGLNIFTLLCVCQNVAQRVYRGGKTPTLDTSRAERARAVQVLVFFVLAFELAAFCSFVSSMFFTEDGDGRLLYFGLIEISLALFGLHMTVETIMFEQVVMIFRSGANQADAEQARLLDIH
ncbi:hypothetical protein HK105_206553 [Polyrhizophydium stewartii]|uniref:Uncharacterized protein n=1 Tax=Polyrhizophydium stewartii TaxID=2732419 RepID=A0ABR4N329_9FUNG